MKIAVVGVGGLGGYIGGRLAQSGQEVTFLARGERLAALRQNGLQVRSPDKERSALLDDRLRQVGRQPGDVKRTAFLPVLCGRNEDEIKYRLGALYGSDQPVFARRSTSQALAHAATGSSQLSFVPTCPSHAQT